jgi:hypothetical protein
MPALLAEVTQTWEVAVAAEAAHIAAMLAAETSAWESSAAWESATLRVNDEEDWATLVEGRR